MGVLAVLGTRLCMGSLFIVCHTYRYHTIPCGRNGLCSAPSARGSTGEDVTVWWGAAEEEGTGNDVVDLSVLVPQSTV